MTLAVTFLESLLDETIIPQSEKTMLKNVIVPALEYIEGGNTPKEVMTRMRQLMHVFGIPSAIAITGAIENESYDKAALLLSEKYYHSTKQILAVLKQANKEIKEKEQ